MQFQNVSILGLAHVDAPHRISSRWIMEQLEPVTRKFGVGPDILEALTGIAARRFWDEGVRPSQAAAWAAEKALEQAGLDRSRLGALVNTSVCRDFIEPSTACLTHGDLGLGPECVNFDVCNACLGFMNGIEIIGNMIERGYLDYGIVVDGEGSRFVVETTLKRLIECDADEKMFRDNFATLTLGSGGGAMVLGRSDLAPDKPRVLGGVNLAATEHNHLCRGQMDEMVTDASGLLKAGLTLAKDTWDRACRELGWNSDHLDHYIVHQVSAVHTSKLCNLLGIQEEKVYKTFPEFGNIGPAAVPITLSKAVEDNVIKKGDKVGLLGIGSGLNCSMMELVW